MYERENTFPNIRSIEPIHELYFIAAVRFSSLWLVILRSIWHQIEHLPYTLVSDYFSPFFPFPFPLFSSLGYYYAQNSPDNR